MEERRREEGVREVVGFGFFLEARLLRLGTLAAGWPALGVGGSGEDP